MRFRLQQAYQFVAELIEFIDESVFQHQNRIIKYELTLQL